MLNKYSSQKSIISWKFLNLFFLFIEILCTFPLKALENEPPDNILFQYNETVSHAYEMEKILLVEKTLLELKTASEKYPLEDLVNIPFEKVSYYFDFSYNLAKEAIFSKDNLLLEKILELSFAFDKRGGIAQNWGENLLLFALKLDFPEDWKQLYNEEWHTTIQEESSTYLILEKLKMIRAGYRGTGGTYYCENSQPTSALSLMGKLHLNTLLEKALESFIQKSDEKSLKYPMDPWDEWNEPLFFASYTGNIKGVKILLHQYKLQKKDDEGWLETVEWKNFISQINNILQEMDKIEKTEKHFEVKEFLENLIQYLRNEYKDGRKNSYDSVDLTEFFRSYSEQETPEFQKEQKVIHLLPEQNCKTPCRKSFDSSSTGSMSWMSIPMISSSYKNEIETKKSF